MKILKNPKIRDSFGNNKNSKISEVFSAGDAPKNLGDFSREIFRMIYFFDYLYNYSVGEPIDL